jgi:putative membrane protein
MRSCFIGIALIATLGVACNRDQSRSNVGGQHGSAPGEGGGASGAATPPSTDVRLSAADQAFVQKAAKGNEAEIEMAKMAEDKAQNREIKDYASMLERDHSDALENLRDLAQKANVTLDTAPPAEKASMSNKLNAASGTQFDREYINTMVEEHRKNIAEFERMQGSATGELKAFIDNTLPTMREHLAKAEQLMKEVGTK